MKKNRNTTLFFVIVLAVFIVVIGVMAGKTNTTIENSTNNELNTENDQSDKNTFSGNVVYIVKSTDGNDLYKISNNKNPVKFFTDKDEEVKITSAKSITSNGNVLVNMSPEGQEFGGSLYLININENGKKKIIVDNFASTETPIISPNGNKIAYTLFSNVESDYGFSLYIMNSDGSNKVKIASNDIGIKILSWNSDSSKIAYTKGDISKESIIYKYEFNSESEEKICSFKEKIYSLNWTSEGIVFSKGPVGEESINKSEIYQMDENGKNIKRLTSDDKHDDYCFYSPGGNYIAYLNISYEKNLDVTKSGEIKIMNSSGSDAFDIAEANYIIGFVGN